jgi:hypothetical protein
MLTIILLLIAIAAVAVFVNKSYQQKQQNELLKSGDIATLKSVYHKDYPFIPANNVLHILDVDGEYVKVEYIDFKDGSYHKQQLSKDAVRKVKKKAA